MVNAGAQRLNGHPYLKKDLTMIDLNCIHIPLPLKDLGRCNVRGAPTLRGELTKVYSTLVFLKAKGHPPSGEGNGLILGSLSLEYCVQGAQERKFYLLASHSASYKSLPTLMKKAYRRDSG